MGISVERSRRLVENNVEEGGGLGRGRKFRMASTLPPQSSAGGGMVFVPPTKRNRTSSGKTNTFAPSRNGPTRSVYGDQILNVQGRIPGSSNEHLETDVLGSLEKLQTLGTMRSIRSNGSIPTWREF